MKKAFFGFILISLMANASTSGTWSSSRAATIALIQFNADRSFAKADANRAALAKLAQSAVKAGAQMVVTPEGSTYGYADAQNAWCSPGTESCAKRSCVDVTQVAEQVPGGKTTAFWSEFSKRNQVYVLYSVPEKEGSFFYNTIGVTGPQGYVTKYRKRDLYYIDECYARPGTSPTLLETPFGRFGMMVCMDGVDYHSYQYEEYRKLGAQGILMPMDWDDDPNGPNAAHPFFRTQAQNHELPIYVSDVSTWDGTGLYPANGTERLRPGISEPAIGESGFVLVPAPGAR